MSQSPLATAGTYTSDGRPILFYAKALYDYPATINEELDLKAGDLIAVTETPKDGWWSGELVDDQQRQRQPRRHVFPSNYVSVSRHHAKSVMDDHDAARPILFYVRALYDYAATTDEEFSFRAGDLIAVMDTRRDGWWHGKLVDDERRRGQPGRHVFPSNFVVLLDVNMKMSQPSQPASTIQNGQDRAIQDDQDRQVILFYVKALCDYTPTTDDEFDFKAGDVIAVMGTPEHGWWRGELIDDGRRQPGRVFSSRLVSSPCGDPKDLAPVPSSVHTRTHTDDGRLILLYVKALYDYSATLDDELNFRAGDLIAVTHAPEDGWWKGELVDEMQREVGRDMFPSNFVSSV